MQTQHVYSLSEKGVLASFGNKGEVVAIAVYISKSMLLNDYPRTERLL